MDTREDRETTDSVGFVSPWEKKTIRFGQLLIERGMITMPQLVRGLDEQHRRQRPIGRLAMEARMMTLGQVAEVLGHLATSTHELFGEVAAIKGYLRPEQISELLEIQRTSRPRIGEILVEQGAMTAEQLAEALEDIVQPA